MNATPIMPGLAVALLMAGAAYAQNSNSSSSNAPRSGQTSAASQSGAAQTAQNLPQQIRDKLRNQGYSDVQVVPGSFLVSAKDKDGDPVTMVIGPHSMTMFTVVSNESDSATTGASGGKTGQSQSGSRR